ncbi:hypothetical protein GCM10020331_094130 [Ectobacillus funiculus]
MKKTFKFSRFSNGRVRKINGDIRKGPDLVVNKLLNLGYQKKQGVNHNDFFLS